MSDTIGRPAARSQPEPAPPPAPQSTITYTRSSNLVADATTNTFNSTVDIVDQPNSYVFIFWQMASTLALQPAIADASLSCKLAGVAMTRLGTVYSGSGTRSLQTVVFGLADPAAGTAIPVACTRPAGTTIIQDAVAAVVLEDVGAILSTDKAQSVVVAAGATIALPAFTPGSDNSRTLVFSSSLSTAKAVAGNQSASGGAVQVPRTPNVGGTDTAVTGLAAGLTLQWTVEDLVQGTAAPLTLGATYAAACRMANLFRVTFLGVPHVAVSGTYYLDPVNGDDANDGYTEATPIRSLERAQSIPLRSGYQLLIKSGTVARKSAALATAPNRTGIDDVNGAAMTLQPYAQASATDRPRLGIYGGTANATISADVLYPIGWATPGNLASACNNPSFGLLQRRVMGAAYGPQVAANGLVYNGGGGFKFPVIDGVNMHFPSVWAAGDDANGVGGGTPSSPSFFDNNFIGQGSGSRRVTNAAKVMVTSGSLDDAAFEVRWDRAGAVMAVVTGSISGSTLTVTAVTSGKLVTNYGVSGAGVAFCYIASQISGTVGGIGTYKLTVSQTVPATTLTISRGVVRIYHPDIAAHYGNGTLDSQIGSPWLQYYCVGNNSRVVPIFNYSYAGSYVDAYMPGPTAAPNTTAQVPLYWAICFSPRDIQLQGQYGWRGAGATLTMYVNWRPGTDKGVSSFSKCTRVLGDWWQVNNVEFANVGSNYIEDGVNNQLNFMIDMPGNNCAITNWLIRNSLSGVRFDPINLGAGVTATLGGSFLDVTERCLTVSQSGTLIDGFRAYDTGGRTCLYGNANAGSGATGSGSSFGGTTIRNVFGPGIQGVHASFAAFYQGFRNGVAEFITGSRANSPWGSQTTGWSGADWSLGKNMIYRNWYVSPYFLPASTAAVPVTTTLTNMRLDGGEKGSEWDRFYAPWVLSSSGLSINTETAADGSIRNNPGAIFRRMVITKLAVGVAVGGLHPLQDVTFRHVHFMRASDQALLANLMAGGNPHNIIIDGCSFATTAQEDYTGSMSAIAWQQMSKVMADKNTAWTGGYESFQIGADSKGFAWIIPAYTSGAVVIGPVSTVGYIVPGTKPGEYFAELIGLPPLSTFSIVPGSGFGDAVDVDRTQLRRKAGAAGDAFPSTAATGTTVFFDIDIVMTPLDGVTTPVTARRRLTFDILF